MRATQTISQCGLPGKIGAISLQCAVAGLTSDFVMDGRFGNFDQMALGAGAYGAVRASWAFANWKVGEPRPYLYKGHENVVPATLFELGLVDATKVGAVPWRAGVRIPTWMTIGELKSAGLLSDKAFKSAELLGCKASTLHPLHMYDLARIGVLDSVPRATLAHKCEADLLKRILALRPN